MLLCEHLEVSGFATYSVITDDRMEKMMLQRCMSCEVYLTLDSKEITPERIMEEINGVKNNMRTLTTHINSALYEKLQDLMHKESGTDSSKIMSEIVALGIDQYKKTLSPQIS